MKHFSALLLLLTTAGLSFGQTQVIQTPRQSPKASISQMVGLTEIQIDYSRPAAKGREIWGNLVPYGMSNPGWGTAESAPWRAGANENTVIHFSTEVNVDGTVLSAGSYGLFMTIEESGEAEVLLSKNTASWGAYFYDEEEIVARIKSSTEAHPATEWLKYEFSDIQTNAVTCALLWGEKRIPFTVSVDLEKTVLTSIRNDLKGTARFSYIGPLEAASWCLNNEMNYEEALGWAEESIAMNPQFANLRVKAALLEKLGKHDDSKATMDKALEFASVFQIHAYGRQLLAQDEADEALRVFQMNAKKHPNTWPVNYGLARGYSAKGNFKKAITYLEKAEKNCPDTINRNMIKTNIERLKKGEDINA